MSEFNDMMNEIEELRKNSDDFLSFFVSVNKYYPINEFSKEQQELFLEYLLRKSSEAEKLTEDRINKFLNNE